MPLPIGESLYAEFPARGTQILVDGKDKTGSIRSWQRNGGTVDITYNTNGKTYTYAARRVRFVDSALANPSADKCFAYLYRIAQTVGLKDSDGNNILASRYAKIGFVSENSMLSAFLRGKLDIRGTGSVGNAVYPFGFNLSQKLAVENALSSPLSIIEGPPGTGKTQTILNIIANAIMRGESVAAVSSNNSATANILEKLQKYNAGFVAALLGNSDNKREFIESQKPLPDLSAWKLSPERGAAVRQQLQTLFVSLERMLVKKNELSRLKQELDAIEVEHKHFIEYYDERNTPAYPLFKKNVNSATALGLWLLCEQLAENSNKPNWFERLKNYFRRRKILKCFIHGMTNKIIKNLSPEIMITAFQKRYYEAKVQELTADISALYMSLEAFDFDARMREYADLSAKVFRDKLAGKYGGGAETI